MQLDNHYLFDILESARLIVTYLGEKARDELYNDMQCQDAIVRRFEIIGEAARKVSKETKSDLANLPWKEMVGMRNILIHEYDVVDVDILWDTVKDDLPELIVELEQVFPDRTPKA